MYVLKERNIHISSRSLKLSIPKCLQAFCRFSFFGSFSVSHILNRFLRDEMLISFYFLHLSMHLHPGNERDFSLTQVFITLSPVRYKILLFSLRLHFAIFLKTTHVVKKKIVVLFAQFRHAFS